MSKQVVDLSEHEHPFLGIIILGDTEVFYTNQMGGTACGHPRVEGLYIPLVLSGEAPSRLRDRRSNLWVGYEQTAVRVCLEMLGVDHVLAPVSYEEQSAAAFLDCIDADSRVWGEAWIPVKVIPAEDRHATNAALLNDFVLHYGILTYNNSD